MALHQVGGHAASFSVDRDPESSGSTLIKTSCPVERNFYTKPGPELAQTYWDSQLVPEKALGASEGGLKGGEISRRNEGKGGEFIGVWTPAFFGVLTRNQSAAPASLESSGGKLASEPSSEVSPPEMLVLENLAYRFLRPNILDIKLGTKLYDADATAEKRQRMDESARATTSALTGMRFTGFQVWDKTSASFVKTEKSYGKSLGVEQLGIALSKYLNSPPATSSAPSSIPEPPVLAETSPLPEELVRLVVKDVLGRVRELETILSRMEFRMIGGSLLIVYEGDEDALRSALDRETAATKSATESHSAPAPGDDSTSDAESEDSVSTSDLQGDALPHTRISCDVRLIDFAHTRAAPGEGPDEGVLQGLGKTRELLEGWLSEHS